MMKNLMRNALFMLVATASLLVLGISAAFAIPAAPDANMPIVDETGTLSQSDIEIISATIDNQNTDNRGQIAVYMTSELPDGQSIEEASLDVAREWGIGSAEDKNGVLLYIAKDDREMRIEVADAASEYLTDSESVRILDNSVAPGFKNGDFAGGIDAGVEDIRAEINGEIGNGSNNDNGTATPVNWSAVGTVLLWIFLGLAASAFIAFVVYYAVNSVKTARKNKRELVAKREKMESDNKILTEKVSTMSTCLNEKENTIDRMKRERRYLLNKVDDYETMKNRLEIAETDPKRFAKMLADEEAERQRIAEEKRKLEEARLERLRLEREEAERKAEEERRYWASPEGKAEKRRITEEKRRQAEEAERKRKEAEKRRRDEEERRRKRREEKEEEERRRRNLMYGASFGAGSSFGSSGSSNSSFGGGGGFNFGGGGGFNGGGGSSSW